MKRILMVILAGALACGTAAAGDGPNDSTHRVDGPEAGQGQAAEKGPLAPHLGTWVVTRSGVFEVVPLPDGIRVYTYGSDRKPVPAEGMRGKVVLTRADKDKQTLQFKYVAGAPAGGEKAAHARDYLFAAVDLSKAEPGSFTAAFDLFPEDPQGAMLNRFTVPFGGLVDAPFVCPMCPDGWGRTAKSSCAHCGMHTTARRVAIPDTSPGTEGKAEKPQKK